MDFTYQYTEEQEEFRKEVRSWLQENIPDDKRAPVDRNELSDEMYAWWRDMHQTLAEKGWLYPTYPKEYGGGDLSTEEALILD
ncbi:MAG TPA: acyl-CoA dehydrogenase, partial [Dehalococcoidia bacterium]|nr:acyl-CoA dehydrogenase [Dehalococcoidia bacterium]